MISLMSKTLPLMLVLLAVLAPFRLDPLQVAAVDTPWILGDEASVACYTLDTQEDIPKPVGLEMHWTVPPPTTLDSTASNPVKYWARVQDNFWTHASNVALLGTEYAKYYRLCLNETGGCDTEDCCIWHSNVHSCRAESGACEPWVSATNGTDATGSEYTLVTHTAALEGGMEVWTQDVRLDDGDWVLIAHVKIMNFQCAVGATRRSVTPDNSSSNDDTSRILTIALIAIVSVLLISVATAVAVRQLGRSGQVAHAPKEENSKFCSMFISLKNETVLWERRGSQMPEITRRYHQIVDTVAKRNKCYVVKRIGGATLVVSKEPIDMLQCASEAAEALAEDAKELNTALEEGDDDGSNRGSNRDGLIRAGSQKKSFILGPRKSNTDSEGPILHSARNSIWSVRSGLHSVVGPISTTAPLTYSMGLHYDRGHIKYEEDRHAYDYTGPCVDGAAVVSDKAQPHQLLATKAVFVKAPKATSLFGDDCFIEFCTTDLVSPSSSTDTTLLQFNPPRLPSRTFEVLTDDNDGTGNGGVGAVDSIAAVLEQQSTGVTKKTITVVAAYLPELEQDSRVLSRQAFGSTYSRKMNFIHHLVVQEKGHVQSSSGGELILTFNAVRPCPNQVLRAYTVVEDLKRELAPNMTAGICSDVGVVGTINLDPVSANNNNKKNGSGSGSQPHHCLMSKALGHAQILRRLCAEYPGAHCLSHSDMHDDLSTCAVEEFVDFFQFPGSVKPKILMSLRQLGADDEGGDDPNDFEWMYQLEKNVSSNQNSQINATFLKIAKFAGNPPPNSDDELYAAAGDSAPTSSAPKVEGFEHHRATLEEEVEPSAVGLTHLKEIFKLMQDYSQNQGLEGNTAATDSTVRPIDAILSSYLRNKPRFLV